MKLEPRKPTEEEKGLLAIYLHTAMGGTMEEAGWHIPAAAIAVFDHYMTDSPGYSGKLMMVVWPGAPELHEVYIWQDKGLERVRNDFA